jgi:hypothetical protein|tara:strand:- start:713 stop:1558 length:846 start_codon:yes stop_codon:yes gene_type:complete
MKMGSAEYHRKKSNQRYLDKPFWYTNRDAKKRAKKLNLDYDLTEEYIESIYPKDGKCPALGIKLKKLDGSNAPSLDRIVPELGYIKGNIQWVSKIANQVMSNATPDQVIQVGEYFKSVINTVTKEDVISKLLKEQRDKISVISGEAYWSHVITPHTIFNPDGEWRIEVCNLDAKSKKILKDDKIERVDLLEDGTERRRFLDNKQDQRGDFIKIKIRAKNRDGSLNNIYVEDCNSNPFHGKYIGNGSKVEVAYYPVSYNLPNIGVRGVVPALVGVKVTKLIG